MASISGTLYIGITNFIEKRVKDHKEGLIEGFSKKYKCTRLVYYESFDDVRKAISREKQVEGLASREEDWSDRKKRSTLARLERKLGQADDISGREFSRESCWQQLRRPHSRGPSTCDSTRSCSSRAALRMTLVGRYLNEGPDFHNAVSNSV